MSFSEIRTKADISNPPKYMWSIRVCVWSVFCHVSLRLYLLWWNASAKKSEVQESLVGYINKAEVRGRSKLSKIAYHNGRECINGRIIYWAKVKGTKFDRIVLYTPRGWTGGERKRQKHYYLIQNWTKKYGGRHYIQQRTYRIGSVAVR